eukprot:365252-Chlamydomonas_euryale.AAC.16
MDWLHLRLFVSQVEALKQAHAASSTLLQDRDSANIGDASHLPCACVLLTIRAQTLGSKIPGSRHNPTFSAVNKNCPYSFSSSVS